MATKQPIDFPFCRGLVEAPDELGDITVGNIRVFPYAQPNPCFELTRDGLVLSGHTTNGVQLIQDNLGDWEKPILVRAGLGLMAALMISPPGQRLSLHDVQDMRVIQDRTGMLMTVPVARFGIPAGSAMVFAEKYSGTLKFVDINRLPEDDY